MTRRCWAMRTWKRRWVRLVASSPPPWPYRVSLWKTAIPKVVSFPFWRCFERGRFENAIEG